ncbi:MAG: T9SS type A sorting domain-containing protein, partial [Bacteroidota bacterium]
LFPLGDAGVYRPIYVSNTNSAYHLLTAELVEGDANTGSSMLTGGISAVSGLRYYKATVGVVPGKTPAAFILTGSGIGYYADDGVSDGNTDLRIALSFDDRASWTSFGPTGHTTSTGSSPTQLLSSALSQSVDQGGSFYLSLANATGGGNTLPVEISEFNANIRSSYAMLVWRTAVETNSVGFEIERLRVIEGKNSPWKKIGFVESHGSSNTPQEYKFIDHRSVAGVVQYRLKMIDRDGRWKYSAELTVEVGQAPKALLLSDNYPNPFNPTTAIEFSVPDNGTAVIAVYNPLGQKIAEIFNGPAEAGKVYYTVFDASTVSSGLYYYELESGVNRAVKKMILLK